MRNKPVILVSLAFSLFLGLLLSDCKAQSIQLTSPIVSETIPDSDDYASVVLNNAWDFNETRDIAWDENFVGSSIVSSNGIWKGTSKDPGAYLFPLFPGFADSLFPEPLEGDRSLPKLGIRHSINSAKYTLLSFKLKHSSRSSISVLWNTNPSGQYWPDGSQMGSSFDGYYTPKMAVQNPNNSWVVYSYDMKNLAKSFDSAKGAWNGNIVALRLDPSTTSPAGSNVELDWMRLIDPTSSHDITIDWEAHDIPAVDSKGTIYQTITVFVDTDGSGYDGYPVKYISDNSDPGSYTFNSGLLPPGTYHFYVQINYLKDYSGMSRSNYSAPIVIAAAPSGYFTSPSTVSGKDYATTELGNAWDMSETSDVVNLPGSSWTDAWRQYSNQSFSNGIFQAVANLPLTGSTETDAQIHLNVSQSKKIDTSKYRYLTYRIAADNSQYANISEMVNKGFVTRPVFWDIGLFEDGGHTKAHVLYEGYHTYTMDLWETGITESGRKWKDNLDLSHLRLDPLETSAYNWFFLDWATLTAENYAENNSYDIDWVIEDSNGGAFSTSLYYDEDSTGFNGTLITQLDGLSSGQHSFTWDTSGLEPGKTFYIYAVVSKANNSRAFYAPAPIKTGTYLKSTTCSEWNGFLNMWNVMEHLNLSDHKLAVQYNLYSIAGEKAGITKEFSIKTGIEYDLLVHDMDGFTNSSYGKVCSTASNASPGDLDGRMVYYKPELDSKGVPSGGYQFAFAMPFGDGIAGSQFVPYNTYQPSLDIADAGNLVANWIQITNLESSAQKGNLIYYDMSGLEIANQSVTLQSGARTDYSGHDTVGRTKVGIIEWRPKDSAAKFGLRNVRYLYASDAKNFDSAFQLEGIVGIGDIVSVPLDTTGGASAILELANTLSESVNVRVQIYRAEGGNSLHDKTYALNKHQTYHLITDQILAGSKGIAVIQGNKAGSVIATAMQYGRTARLGIQTLYGIQARPAIGTLFRGTYNTFLGQSCRLLVTNAGSYDTTVTISMKRYDGADVLEGLSEQIPAHGLLDYDLCKKDIVNTYGIVTTRAQTADTVIATVLRIGENEQYRFPTPVR